MPSGAATLILRDPPGRGLSGDDDAGGACSGRIGSVFDAGLQLSLGAGTDYPAAGPNDIAGCASGGVAFIDNGAGAGVPDRGDAGPRCASARPLLPPGVWPARLQHAGKRALLRGPAAAGGAGLGAVGLLSRRGRA